MIFEIAISRGQNCTQNVYTFNDLNWNFIPRINLYLDIPIKKIIHNLHLNVDHKALTSFLVTGFEEKSFKNEKSSI